MHNIKQKRSGNFLSCSGYQTKPTCIYLWEYMLKYFYCLWLYQSTVEALLSDTVMKKSLKISCNLFFFHFKQNLQTYTHLPVSPKTVFWGYINHLIYFCINYTSSVSSMFFSRPFFKVEREWENLRSNWSTES